MLRLLLALCIVLLLLIIGLAVFFLFILEPADRTLLLSKKQTLQSQGATRTYRLAVPRNADKKPLIIGLHGYQDRALWHGMYSGLHLLAQQENTVVALPDGQRQSWNGSFCCGWSFANGARDSRFIIDMIKDIKSQHDIDESRIYIVGFSNGGLMAQKMITEHPDVFAAAAGFMSGIGDNENVLDISQAQTPLLLVNGNEDNYVPVNMTRNISGFNFIPAQTTADLWAEQYQLENKQESARKTFTEYTWSDSLGNPSQQLILRIYPSKHRWPEWRIPHFSSTVPEPTQDMWEFFSQHSL